MAKRACVCGICDNVNSPSVCSCCINLRLTETYKVLRRLSQQRDALQRRLDAKLTAKREAEIQRHWRAEHAERKARLREQLRISTNELMKGKARGEQLQGELDSQTTLLATASSELALKQVEQLGQYYPDLIRTHSLGYSALSLELSQKRRTVVRQLCKILPLRRNMGFNDREESEGSKNVQPVRICGAQLPVGDDPLSVPGMELAASLGYLVQLVNLAAKYLCAPLLHSAGFAASSSRVWQRASYWDSRPSIRSDEYPLFLPQENGPSGEESRDLVRSQSSKLGFSSMEGSNSNSMESSASSLARSGSALTGPREAHKDVQRGIKLLKRSVSCVCSYGFGLLAVRAPSELSTLENFSELLSALSSRELRTRSSRGSQQPNERFGLSDGHLIRLESCPPNLMEESKPSSNIMSQKASLKGRASSWNDFTELGLDSEHLEGRIAESTIDGWDLVEHPTLPPPPSHSEDVEHWTRAMFIDATK